MLKLERLPIITAIVGDGGKPTAYFQKLWDLFATEIENGDAAQEALLLQLQEQQQQILVALGQVQAVQAVANNANSGSGNRQSASNTTTVNSGTWTTFVSVTFTGAVAASAVQLGSSGPTSGAARINPASPSAVQTQTGQVRILEGATVVAGPINYTVDSNGVLTFSGFSALGADATTGSITYNLQARQLSGAAATLTFLLDVTRTP